MPSGLILVTHVETVDTLGEVLEQRNSGSVLIIVTGNESAANADLTMTHLSPVQRFSITNARLLYRQSRRPIDRAPMRRTTMNASPYRSLPLGK
jgi:hypothetical protein